MLRVRGWAQPDKAEAAKGVKGSLIRLGDIGKDGTVKKRICNL